MASLGVFRDDFYNAIHVLPASQGTAGPTTTGTLVATALAGAVENMISVGNGAAAAETYTTDTAVNIIAQLQVAVAAAVKANVGGFVASLSAPPLGVPNLFNVSFTVTLSNQGTTTASVLAAGAGVTLATLNAGISATAIPAATAATTPVVTRYVVTITSANTVTFTRVQ